MLLWGWMHFSCSDCSCLLWTVRVFGKDLWPPWLVEESKDTCFYVSLQESPVTPEKVARFVASRFQSTCQSSTPSFPHSLMRLQDTCFWLVSIHKGIHVMSKAFMPRLPCFLGWLFLWRQMVCCSVPGLTGEMLHLPSSGSCTWMGYWDASPYFRTLDVLLVQSLDTLKTHIHAEMTIIDEWINKYWA